jgi:hypothetical protein
LQFARLRAWSYLGGVEARTRRRVHLDTTPSRVGRWLMLSVVLHAPLTPIAGLIGLLHFFDRRDQEVPVLPPVTEIPLDLIDEAELAQPAEPVPPPAPAEPPAPVVEAPPAEPEPEAPKPKPKPQKPPKPATPVPEPGSSAAPDKQIADPLAGVGSKKLVDPNANIRLLVHNDRVRQHPLGPRVGPMLRSVYQWRDFLGPTAIDPIRDIDRMLIVGPQFRDSRDLVAVLEHRVPETTLREAIDQLVARDPEGGWLDTPVPVARATADRGERLFVMPSQHILIITPPSAQRAAEGYSKTNKLSPPAPDELARAYLNVPWRALVGTPVTIPKSIRWARLRVNAAADGGAEVDIVAQDESESLATSNAHALERAVRAATEVDLGLFGAVLFGSSQKRFIQSVSFVAEANEIRGEIQLTRAQLETVLDLLHGMLGGPPPKRRVPAASASAKAQGVPPPQPVDSAPATAPSVLAEP